MNAFRNRLFGGGAHKYAPLGYNNGSSESETRLLGRKHIALVVILVALAGLTAVFILR